MIGMAILLGLCDAAAPLAAQPPPGTGMVAEPCAGLVVPVPDAVKAYFRLLATLPQSGTRPGPPAEFAVYRQSYAAARKNDWADLCRYQADNERLRAGPAVKRRTVFIGDSITELWGLDDPDLFNDNIVNRGISGQTSPQILLRFQADVLALKPAAVHILVGTNDIAGNTGPTSVEQYRNNIKAMVTLAKANGIRVILGSMPPSDFFPSRPAFKPAPQIAFLNMWLKAYAERENIGFIDYHALLVAGGDAMDPELSFDGVHPNSRGYRRMTGAMLGELPSVR